jgi:hypothetical protein
MGTGPLKTEQGILGLLVRSLPSCPHKTPNWAVLVSVLMLGLTARPANADLIWGINGHPLNSYPGVTFDEQLDHIAKLGLKMYRVDVGDLKLMPRLANLIAKAKTRGITILPVLTPPGSFKKSEPAELYNRAYEFAAAYVGRFKDDIRIWELGNELENYAIIQPCEQQDDGKQYNCKWGPAGGARKLDYYGPRWKKVSAVLRGLSDATISVDPTIKKAIGTAGWGHTGAFARMQDDGIQWDITVWHMYSYNNDWAFKQLVKYNRPIWITEFNNPYGSQKGLEKQSDGLTQIIAYLRNIRKKYNIEAAHIYELLDERYWAPSFEAHMGLITLEKDGNKGWKLGVKKPAYKVVKQLLGLHKAAMKKE